MYNGRIERTEQPECLKSDRLKSELNFVRFSKLYDRISDIYCSLDFGHKTFGFWTIRPKVVRFEPKSLITEHSDIGIPL